MAGARIFVLNVSTKMKRRLKVNGVLICLAVILLIFFPAVFFRGIKETRWDACAKIFGVTFILLGQILRASGRGYKSENSGSGHSLIQGGPYTLVRNPMYLGILLIGLGVVLVLFNWWIAVVFLCIFIWRYILLIFTEENKLSSVFGGAYEDYLKRVPRILPSPAMLLTKDIAEYLPLKALWLKKEISSMLAVLLIVFILEGWQGIQSAGIGIFLQEAILFFVIMLLFMLFILYLIRRTNNQNKYASNKA